jgi:anti-sigma B factor antagonist
MVEIERKNEEGTEVLTIRGEVDASSSIDLDQAIGNCVREGATQLLVDCTGLDYISSAGLGVFISYVEEFREKGVRLVMFGLNSRVSHTFSLLGLADLMEITPDRESANRKLHEA